MRDFDAATSIAPSGEGRWAAAIRPGWDIGGRANGGYLLALAGRAGLLATGRPHPLAVSAHFLHAPEPGPVEAVIRVLRDGRSTGTAAVDLIQSGRHFLSALVSAGTLVPAEAPHHLVGRPPSLPPVAACIRAEGDLPGGSRVGLLDHVDMRLDPATVGWAVGRPGGRAEVRGWVRFTDGREPDPLGLLLIADALPPVTFDLGLGGWVPTLELTVYVRGVPSPGWLRASMRAQMLDGGWIDEEAEVWDSAGRLVAQACQLAGTRVPGRP